MDQNARIDFRLELGTVSKQVEVTAEAPLDNSTARADALQEFKIQPSSYSAENGRTSGGVINTVIKSGTNQIHGSVYEFFRNSAMDANSFFANRAGRDLPSFERNQFGFTTGEPIKRNKAFFFVSWKALRLRASSTATRTVPQRSSDRAISPVRLRASADSACP